MEYVANFGVTYPQIRSANGRLSIKARLSMPRSDLDIEVIKSAYVDASHEIGHRDYSERRTTLPAELRLLLLT
jgi:hypothetical protein